MTLDIIKPTLMAVFRSTMTVRRNVTISVIRSPRGPCSRCQNLGKLNILYAMIINTDDRQASGIYWAAGESSSINSKMKTDCIIPETGE